MAGLRGPVRRLPDGGIRVRLSSREREVLRTLPSQLAPLLSGEQDLQTPGGSVRERLFPSAYDDPVDELEYRELTGGTVASERLAALEAFARTLDEGVARRGGWIVDLSDDETAAWLSALNDARLTLAMVVGVTDDDQWSEGPDRSDPTSLLLYYLGWLQEELLAVLMGSLDDQEGSDQ